MSTRVPAPLCFYPLYTHFLLATQAYSAAQKAGEDSRKAVDKLQELQQAKAEADAKLRALHAELAEADHQLAPAQVHLCGAVVGWVWGKQGVVCITPPAGFWCRTPQVWESGVMCGHWHTCKGQTSSARATHEYPVTQLLATAAAAGPSTGSHFSLPHLLTSVAYAAAHICCSSHMLRRTHICCSRCSVSPNASPAPPPHRLLLPRPTLHLVVQMQRHGNQWCSISPSTSS